MVLIKGVNIDERHSNQTSFLQSTEIQTDSNRTSQFTHQFAPKLARYKRLWRLIQACHHLK